MSGHWSGAKAAPPVIGQAASKGRGDLDQPVTQEQDLTGSTPGKRARPVPWTGAGAFRHAAGWGPRDRAATYWSRQQHPECSRAKWGANPRIMKATPRHPNERVARRRFGPAGRPPRYDRSADASSPHGLFFDALLQAETRKPPATPVPLVLSTEVPPRVSPPIAAGRHSARDSTPLTPMLAGRRGAAS